MNKNELNPQFFIDFFKKITEKEKILRKKIYLRMEESVKKLQKELNEKETGNINGSGN